MAHRLIPEGAPPPMAIVGTTASGKSALALALARLRGDVELVSVDSMQVYRGMDIGTAKPTAAEQAEVGHHVIDLADPWEPFEVHSFQAAVAGALADIAARDRRAVLVGGTGLYLQAVIDGFEIPGRYPDVLAELDADPDTEGLHRRLAELDPVAAARMEPTNRRRVLRALEVTVGSGRPFSSYGPGVGVRPPTPVRQVGIRLPQPVVAERIEARYHRQMADGFLDEVRRLRAGPPLSRTAAQALGYRELLAHLDAVDPAGTSESPDEVDPADEGADPDPARLGRSGGDLARLGRSGGDLARLGRPGGKEAGSLAASGTLDADADADPARLGRSGGDEARPVPASGSLDDAPDPARLGRSGGDLARLGRSGGKEAGPLAASGSLDDALEEAIRRTRAFARRQRAWFRRDPRITWLDADHDPLDRLPDLVEIATTHWPP